jgi:hypothetical protein
MFFQLEELNRSFVIGDKRSGRGKFMSGRRFRRLSGRFLKVERKLKL